MRKLIIKILLYIILPISLLTLAMGTFAWFGENENLSLDTRISQGLVIQQYFHFGDGTKQDSGTTDGDKGPFIITRPIHYYHLVELYQRNSQFENADYYFQIGYELDGDTSNGLEVYNYDDYGNVIYETDANGAFVYDSNGNKKPTYSKTLNMAYYSGDIALIPVGTSTNPFNGKFDGSGLTIKNLNIISSETIGSVTYDTCDVGVFGYVGNRASIHDVYFDNLQIDIVNVNANTTCASEGEGDASNAHSDNECYVGYVIGHLYQFSNATDINYYTGTVGSNASPIYNIYLNNVSVVGGNNSTIECRYGYIGYIDLLDGLEAQTISKLYEQIAETQGGDEGWGGSMDMQQLYNRLVTITPTSGGDRTYMASETIDAGPTVRDANIVTETAKSTTNASSISDIYYWSAADSAGVNVPSNMTGGSTFASRTSSWNYLYGMETGKTVSTTTWYKSTESSDIKTAYLLFDNSVYLALLYENNTASLVGKTGAANGSKWVPEDEADGLAYYFTYYYHTKYYLTVKQVGSGYVLDVSTSKSTKWSRNDSEFYTAISGTNYYLTYTGTWDLVAERTRYSLTDGEGHYLTATANAITNADNITAGSMWVLSNPTGNTTFSFLSGGETYYLSFVDGELGVSKTVQTLWTRTASTDGKTATYSVKVNGVIYYLIYDSGWRATITDAYKIHSGTNYIGRSTTTVTNVTQSDGLLFQINSTTSGYQIITPINGDGYYLGWNGTEVILSTTAFSWKKDGYNRFYTSLNVSPLGEKNYYLIYNNGWILSPLTGYKFLMTISETTHYLDIKEVNTPTGYQKVLGDGELDNSTIWQLSSTGNTTSIFTTIGTDTYYLSASNDINNVGLSLSNTVVNWTKDGTGYYVKVGYDNLYLTYTDRWTLTPKNSFYISDNNEHYLSYKNTAIVSSSKTSAVKWQITEYSSGKFYIYQLQGINKNYLGVAENTLAKTSTECTWVRETDGTTGLYKYYTMVNGVKYYLYYDNALGWTLLLNETQNKISYQMDENGQRVDYYLCANERGLYYTNDYDQATTWIIDGYNYMYIYIGGVKYYLNYEVKTIKEYDIVNEQQVCVNAYKKIVPCMSSNPRAWTVDGWYGTVIGPSNIGKNSYLYFNEFTREWDMQLLNGYRIQGSEGFVGYLDVGYDPVDLTADEITFGEPYLKLSTDTNGVYPLFVYNKITSGNTNEWLLYTFVGDQIYYVHVNSDRDGLNYMYLSSTLSSDKNDYKIINASGEIAYRDYSRNGLSTYLSYLDGKFVFIPYDYYSWSTTYNGTTYYLYAGVSGTSCAARTSSDASNYVRYYTWKFTTQGTGWYCYSHNINNSIRYLNASSDGSLSMSTSKSTIWYWDSSRKTYYCIISGDNYYLMYSPTKGKFVVECFSYTLIYDEYNSTNFYMNPSGTSVEGSSTQTKWHHKAVTGGYRFYTTVDSTVYWLTWDSTNGLRLVTTEPSTVVKSSATITGSATTATALYWTEGSINYSLAYENGWVVNPSSYSTITIDSTQLSVSGSNRFIFSNTSTTNGTTTTIGVFIKDRIKYLSDSGSGLTTGTTASTWTRCYNTYRITVGSEYHYLQKSGSDLVSQMNTKWYLKDRDSNYYLNYGKATNSYGNFSVAISMSTSNKAIVYTDYSKTTGFGYIHAEAVYSSSTYTIYMSENASTWSATKTSASNTKEWKYSGDYLYCYASSKTRVFTRQNTSNTSWTQRYTTGTIDPSKFSSDSSLKQCLKVDFMPVTSITIGSGTHTLDSCNVKVAGSDTLNITTISEVKYCKLSDRHMMYNYSNQNGSSYYSYNNSVSNSSGIPQANMNTNPSDIGGSNASKVCTYSGIGSNNTTSGNYKLIQIVVNKAFETTNDSSNQINLTNFGYNLKFDGRCIKDLEGAMITADSSHKKINIYIPSTYISKNCKYYGYNYHTLELAAPSNFRDGIIERFRLYLVGSSWTTAMPTDYGMHYENGYMIVTQITGINPLIKQESVSQSYATYSTYTVTKNTEYVLSTITPTQCKIKSNTVNPKIYSAKTTEILYVSSTTNYKRGTYLPLQLDTTDGVTGSTNYYADYRASYKNTGYLVGGTYSEASGSGKGDIRVSGYDISYIRNSYNSSTNKFTTLYTFNDSGTSPVAINNSANSFDWFDTTKEAFLETLKNSGSSVYGLHFMDSTISTSHIMTAEAVLIQNKYYVNYQLPESCIDFNVYTQGSIILYAGDYYTSGNSSFFSLHVIYRDDNQQITSIKEISEIYGKTDMTTKDNYIYKFTDGTYTDSNGGYTGKTSLASGYNTTPVFKMKWLTSPTNGRNFSNRYIYYFEIPCNKGEFALGSVEDSDGGYLLYLDIGTNGNQEYTYNEEAYIGDDPLFTQIEYLSSGTTINSKMNFSYTVPNGATKDNFKITVSYDPNELVTDYRNGVDCTIYTFYITNKTNNPLDITILLMDDDDNTDNMYAYRYRIIYNGTPYTLGPSFDTSINAYYASTEYSLPVA